jgi:hypothetical protein
MTTESFLGHVSDMIEQWVEYEESHQDAGDNYAHLAGEGSFDYHNGTESLTEYCKAQGWNLDGVDIDRLAEDVIFWGYMTPGQDFDVSERFLVSSYQVGEIELQVESDQIGARFTPWLIDKLNRETDAYWRYQSSNVAYCYVVSEAYWDHVCDKDVVLDLINQQRGSE